MNVESTQQTIEVQAPSGEVEISNVETPDVVSQFASDLFPEIVNEEEKKEEVDAGPEAKEEVAPVVEEVKEEAPKMEAPAHWPNEMKDKFNALPRDGQEALLFQSKQLERGYNEKFQQLSKERQRDAAYDGMVQEFQKNPNFAKHVMGFFEQGGTEAQTQKQQESDPYGLGPRPDDPIEQLQYDAAVKAAAAIERKFGAQLQQRDEHNQRIEHQMVVQRVLNDVRQDPLFDKVYKGIAEYIQSQPESFRPGLYQTLDSNPKAFIETYNWVRQRVSSTAPTPSKVQQQLTPVAPRVEPRKEEAPLLESSGADAREANEMTRAKKRDVAKREAAKGNWQPFLKQAVESLGF